MDLYSQSDYKNAIRARVKELVRHKVRNVLCCAGHAFD